MDRRHFLSAGALAALAAPQAARAEPSPAPAAGRKTARNVVFLVSDGMTDGVFAAANHFQRLEHGRDTCWLELYRQRRAVRARMETFSASSIVTDSAAAGSAWGCGQRLVNGSINVDSDGRELKPLLLHAQAAGKMGGLVTTARMTHATPASFAANVPGRWSEDVIADQYLARRIDLLLGGGARHFSPARRADQRDLFGDFAAAGYHVVRDRAALLSAPPAAAPLLGLFFDDHLPYTVDHLASAALRAQVPTLAEMSAHALACLDRHPGGFVLQIEGARVDHAGHSNDAAAMVRDQLAFDDAVRVVAEWSDGRDDTLVILTTDHGTGGFELNGEGKGYRDSTPEFRRLAPVATSFEALWPRLKAASAAARPALLHELYGWEFSAATLAALAPAIAAAEADAAAEGDLHLALGKALAPHVAVNFTSGNHTGDLVELAAWGPGSERLPGFVRNYELFGLIGEALDVPSIRQQAAGAPRIDLPVVNSRLLRPQHEMYA